MSSSESTWSEEEAVQKVLRRAEVSRIARTLQHRLALATYKAKNGLEKLDLDTIEPRVEEDLRRKRSLTRSSEPPCHYGEAAVEWIIDSIPRPMTQSMIEYGSARESLSRKRPRTSASDYQMPVTKRHTWSYHNRGLSRYSPYSSDGTAPDEHDEEIEEPEPPSPVLIQSSPPQTPPPQAFRPTSSLTSTNGEPQGPDVMLYISAMASNDQLLEKARPQPPRTPPPQTNSLPSSVMDTSNIPQTPYTTFNFADFVNITPSPAQAAFPTNRIRTPLAARKRLNFDNMPPNSHAVHAMAAGRRLSTISILEIGGELIK